MRSRWSKFPHFLAEFPRGARNAANRWALIGALTYLAKTQPTEVVEVSADGDSHKVTLDTGQVMVSQRELARLLGMPRDTVKGLLRQLEGWVSNPRSHPGSGCVYDPPWQVKRTQVHAQGRSIITLYEPRLLAGYETAGDPPSDPPTPWVSNPASHPGSGCVSDPHIRELREIEIPPLPNSETSVEFLPPPAGSEQLVQICQKVWNRARKLEPRSNPEPDWYDLGAWWLEKSLNGSINWAEELERFEQHWTTEAIRKTFVEAKKRKSVAQFRFKLRLGTWIKMAEKRGGSNGSQGGSGRVNHLAVRGKKW